MFPARLQDDVGNDPLDVIGGLKSSVQMFHCQIKIVISFCSKTQPNKFKMFVPVGPNHPPKPGKKSGQLFRGDIGVNSDKYSKYPQEVSQEIFNS